MDARGITEPNDKPQEVSGAEQRKQQRVFTVTIKHQAIAGNRVYRTKDFKLDNNKKNIKDQRAGRQINQAMKKKLKKL